MKAIYIERFGAPDVLTYGDRPDPVTAEDDSDHVAGMVSNLMVRLLLVRLAWACCKPRTQVAEGRRKKLAQSVAVTAVVGLIGFAIIH